MFQVKFLPLWIPEIKTNSGKQFFEATVTLQSSIFFLTMEV